MKTLEDDTPLPFKPETAAALMALRVDQEARLPTSKAGVLVLTPHEIRHPFTTLAAQRGVPWKLIDDRLGNANINLIVGI